MEGISKPVEVEKIVDEYDITQYEQQFKAAEKVESPATIKRMQHRKNLQASSSDYSQSLVGASQIRINEVDSSESETEVAKEKQALHED